MELFINISSVFAGDDGIAQQIEGVLDQIVGNKFSLKLEADQDWNEDANRMEANLCLTVCWRNEETDANIELFSIYLDGERKIDALKRYCEMTLDHYGK